jgi:hypothetical protein
MTPLTATEAISPAIEHTKALLLPFSLRLWLKIGLVALLAEAGAQFIFPPFGNSSSGASSGIGATAGTLTSTMVAVFVVMAVVGLLVFLVLIYLASRMQLVLMDIVATRTTLVAPAWHRTASRTWRWIGFKVAVFFAVIIVGGAGLVAPFIYFVRSMPRGNAQPPAPAFVVSSVLFLLIFLVFVLICVCVIWAIRDFVLPFLLFEDATVGNALRSASSLIRREPGSFLFYLFMKVVVSIAAGILGEICILLSGLILCLPLGGIAALLWALLHHSGPFGTAIMYISFGLLGVVFVSVFLGAIICISGAMLTFYQAYALYFLGGRIPVIGNLLQPPPNPAPAISGING